MPLLGPQFALVRAASSMVMNLTDVSLVGTTIAQVASISTEPASMSLWGLLLIAIGLLLRVMRLRARTVRVKSPKAASTGLEPMRPLASSMPR